MSISISALIAKTVATVAVATRTLAAYSYNSKIKLDNIELQNKTAISNYSYNLKTVLNSASLYDKTKLVVLAGFFNIVTKLFADDLAVTDSPNLTVSKQQSDTVELLETVAVVTEFNRIPIEVLNFGDILTKSLITSNIEYLQLISVGTLLNQNYVDGAGYFSSDYVGTSRQLS